MPSFCVVSNCELKYSHSDNISFHKFPFNNPQILKQWINFTGRERLWKPSRWSSICSRHFDQNDFREYLSRKCLKKDAVPTIVTKNNISFETYHIATNSPNASHVLDAVGDEYEAEASHSKMIPMEINCRLCGERNDPTLINSMGSMDDFEIETMFRKCLPTLNILAEVDPSRLICNDCISQLKQYSEFVDRILSYQQKDFVNNDNSAIPAAAEHQIPFAQPPTVNSNIAPISIKQEPINVKQEKIDRKPQESFRSASSIHTKTQPVQESLNEITAEQSSGECSREPVNNEREQTNNCEIMEIITLNKPVSFIDLDEDDAGNVELGKLKMENVAEIDRRVELEHAYARRAAITPYHLKQEIVEMNNEENKTFPEDVSSTEYNHFDSNELELPQVFTAAQHPLNDHEMIRIKTCPICDASFKSIEEYLRHKVKEHLSICLHCKRTFSSDLALRKHAKFCSKELKHFKFSCRYCHKQMRSLIQMRSHVKFCGREQKSTIESNGSQNQVPNLSESTNAGSEQTKYVCSFCYRNFRRLKHFKEHQEMHIKYNHKRDPNMILANETTSSNPSPAMNSANLTFLNRSNDRVTEIDANERSGDILDHKKFTCETCGKGFLNEAKLKQHKQTHSTRKMFNCSLCSKTFKGMSGLKQHIDGFHYKIKPFTCPICLHSYALKSDVQRCRHYALA